MKTLSLSLFLLLTTLTFAQKPSAGFSASLKPDTRKPQQSTPYDELRCMIQSKDGSLWFGSTGDGIYCYKDKHIKQYQQTDPKSNKVWTLLEDKRGTIWAGTEGGLYRMEGDSFMPVFMLGGEQRFAPGMGYRSANAVWALLQDREGLIWIGTEEQVLRYDGRSFHQFPDNTVENQAKLSVSHIGYLMQDRSGNIWLGSNVAGGDGLIRFDGHTLHNFKAGGDGWVRYIIEDRRGRIWFGTRSSGLWRYHRGRYEAFTEKQGIGAPLLSDSKGKLWFSGEEHPNSVNAANGIWRYDGQQFSNFSQKDGMGNYFAWSMLEDRDGNIWIGTRNTGLYRFNGKDFRCIDLLKLSKD